MALNLDQPLLTGNRPRVLSIPMLHALFQKNGRLPSRGALFNWIRLRERDGSLARISRGVDFNSLATPPVLPEEAADFIRRGAVVSLQKVLGDCGFLNNFTPVITAVVPWSRGMHLRTGRFRREGAEFWFRSIPLDVYLAGAEADRLVPCIPYRKATSARALLRLALYRRFRQVGHERLATRTPPTRRCKPTARCSGRSPLNRLCVSPGQGVLKPCRG